MVCEMLATTKRVCVTLLEIIQLLMMIKIFIIVYFYNNTMLVCIVDTRKTTIAAIHARKIDKSKEYKKEYYYYVKLFLLFFLILYLYLLCGTWCGGITILSDHIPWNKYTFINHLYDGWCEFRQVCWKLQVSSKIYQL